MMFSEVFSNIKFQSISTVSSLIFESPTVNFVECHREKNIACAFLIFVEIDMSHLLFQSLHCYATDSSGIIPCLMPMLCEAVISCG